MSTQLDLDTSFGDVSVYVFPRNVVSMFSYSLQAIIKITIIWVSGIVVDHFQKRSLADMCCSVTL